MRSDIAVRVVAPDGLIAERYRLLRPLGAGASATVWAAEDETLGRQVALKLLSGRAAFNEAEREQLRSEARALAALAHPRVIVVFDYLETPGLSDAVQPVLITELLDGQSLSACLDDGPLPWPVALGVCGQLAEALAAAHTAGIVHRDVAPSNVMLTPTGVKLLDFGIAQSPTDRDDPDGMAVGTPVCMAPEQLAGRGAQPASDMYAFGCVLYWCLTGQPPFLQEEMTALSYAHAQAAPPPLEIPGLPRIVVELYHACMSKDMTERPTARQAAELLSPYAHGTAAVPGEAETVLVRSTDLVPHRVASHAGKHRPLNRRRLFPALALLTVAGLTAIVFGLAHGIMDGNTAATHTTGAAPASPSMTPSASPSGASATPTPTPTMTMANVTVPSASASMTPLASASASAPAITPLIEVAFPNPAADPLGYAQALAAEVQNLAAQGPNTLQPAAAQQLENEIGTLQNAVATAQQSHGKKQWRAAASDIAAVQQQVSNDAAAGEVSQSAANLLAGQLQQLNNALPAGA